MRLQSKLFRGDPKLEAAAVSDPGHIMTGAVGQHVAKIQRALRELDKADIDRVELQSLGYGPSTANAVLAYKKKRNIVNRSYQTQADNIVGKMTIAALDKEMLAWETKRVRCMGCGDLIHSTGSQSHSGFVKTAFGTTAQQTFPADLDILWQPSTAAVAKAGNRHLDQLSKALEILKPYNIGIMSSVASPPDRPFPETLSVDPRFKQDLWSLRSSAEKARPAAPKTLRIIVHIFEPSSVEFGVTDGGSFDGVMFPNFVVINANKARADRCTVIHEMIHATGLSGAEHDTEPDSVFSLNEGRSKLQPQYAQRLSKAFFARPKS